MYDPILKQWCMNSPILWIDFGISVVVIGLLLAFIICSSKKKSLTIAGIVCSIISIFSWFVSLKFVWQLSIMVMTAYLAMIFVHNQNDVKEFVGSIFKKRSIKNTQKVYDRHTVCQKVALAVETLSRTKTGALITFEKNTPLSDAVKTGTILNSPVTPELLCTIFYPGTRLHDGAVVIRRDEILAASVYYTPTTKPLTGKFGSRHRAAIGISEITDSVTVIVSEETGRISLAYHGELIPVAPDSFLRTIEEYLFNEEKIGFEVNQ